MKNLFMLFILAIVPAATQAANQLPRSIDFTFSAQEATEMASKEFCRVIAGTETYYPILGESIKSEYLRITCDGKTFVREGQVSQSGYEQRMDEILGQAMSQLLKMGFKVVTCDTSRGSYRSATCTVAKSVHSKEMIIDR